VIKSPYRAQLATYNTTHHDVQRFYVLVDYDRVSGMHELNTMGNTLGYGNPVLISCLRVVDK